MIKKVCSCLQKGQGAGGFCFFLESPSVQSAAALKSIMFGLDDVVCGCHGWVLNKG
jgi:hypothetical protein